MNKRFDEVERIEVEISKLEKKLKAAKAERKHLESLDPAKRLAVMLHDKFCHYSHMDQCGWDYESAHETCWTGHAHAKYLDHAKEILAVLNR